MDWAKILGAALTALAVGGGVGGTIGQSHGYSQRDAEITAAFPRCKCKLRTVLPIAVDAGFVRPDDWCEIAEERDE